jgi:FKBP-type peptidyl-prolyl cis-trans isomerase FkpA
MKTSKDSAIQNTFEGGRPIPFGIFKPTYKGCILEAFQLLSEGDSARFIVQADSFFLKTQGAPQVPEGIDPKDQLTFTIKIRKLFTKAYVEEETKKMKVQEEQSAIESAKQVQADSAMIAEYLAKNKIKTVRTPQGVHLEFKKANKGGINLIKGDSVKVHYVGRLLNGTEFDRSGDKPFTLALGYGQVIPGWEDALLQMKKGEKAVVYIPSGQAYGVRGNRGIPPNSILVFDIEVVE